MKDLRRLSAANARQTVNLSFSADNLQVFNSTPFVVLVRAGGLDYPDSARTADVVVPAATAVTVPVSGREFALVLSSDGLAQASGGLSDVALCTFLAGEMPAQLGGIPYEALRLSDDIGGPYVDLSDGDTVGPFDLDNWGGLVAAFSPENSGAGVVTWQTSADNASWYTVGQFTVGANSPSVYVLPRIGRYSRFTLDHFVNHETSVLVRATVAEVLAANPPIVQPVNFGSSILGISAGGFQRSGFTVPEGSSVIWARVTCDDSALNDLALFRGTLGTMDSVPIARAYGAPCELVVGPWERFGLPMGDYNRLVVYSQLATSAILTAYWI